MIRKKIISKLLICCLLVQILTIMNSQDDGYLEEVIEKETRPHWLHATDGNIEVVILENNPPGLNSNISWNESLNVYELEYPSDYLRVQVNATGLEPDQKFYIDWQLYGYVENKSTFGPWFAQDPTDPDVNLVGGIYGPIVTISGVTNYDTGVLRGHPDGLPMSGTGVNLTGCYWVMATLYIEGESTGSIADPQVMQTNLSKRVSYGQPCPVDDGIEEDQDGDGWTDSQELQATSNPMDPDSTPLTVIDSLNATVNSLKTSLSSCQQENRVCEINFNSLNESYNSLFDHYNLLANDYYILWNEYNNTQYNLTICNQNLEYCKLMDFDQDGWSNTTEVVCGSDPYSHSSTPTNCTIGLLDYDGDGVRNVDDECEDTPNGQYVNSTGCHIQQDDLCPCDENIDHMKESEEESDGNDIVNFVFVGGASLLAGLGLSSFLPKKGGWNWNKDDLKDIDSNDLEDIKDIIEDIDLDFDRDSDKPKNPKKSVEIGSGSDQYFMQGVERQKAMTESADPLLDDYVEDEN